MNRVVLTGFLKGAVILALFWGVVFYVWVVPAVISFKADELPELDYLRLSGTIALELTAIPICVTLVALWRIFSNISIEKSFCKENTQLLALVGICAAADTVYIFAFLVFLMIIGAVNFGGLILFSGVIIFGAAIMIMAFLLSHLTGKASVMKEEIDLTV